MDSLSSAGLLSIFPSSDSFESINPTQFYAELERSVESYLLNDAADADAGLKLIVVVAVAVASLFAFVQCNFTG